MNKLPAEAAPIPVPSHKAKTFRALTSVPFIAWPTFGWFVVTVLGTLATDYLAVTDRISLVAGMLINSVLMYPLFGVVHDATHRSISSNFKLNDWIGHIGLFIAVPHANLGLFRWAHSMHHRHTNDARDPDLWMHGRWWTAPIRWPTFDIAYLAYILRNGDRVAFKNLKITAVYVAVTVVIYSALIYYGYGWHLLLLSIIPARITLFTFGFVFFWLPHVKHDVSSHENLTLASGMRLGYEWLMGPLLQFHNYHLIHHLWPSTPPYNHRKLWLLMEPEIRQRDLSVQYDFEIVPHVVKATQSA